MIGLASWQSPADELPTLLRKVELASLLLAVEKNFTSKRGCKRSGDALLCFLLSAIKQANCAGERLDSPGLISLVGKIINKKGRVRALMRLTRSTLTESKSSR
jgi:hypothetical protein